MNGLKTQRKTILLNQMRSEKDYPDGFPSSLKYDPDQYSLHDVIKVLRPEVISILLQLHTICVIRKGNFFQVIAGKRIFHFAAHCFAPDHKIEVAILDRKTTAEQLLLLRYVDLVISSLIFRTKSTVADIFQSINVPELRQQAWLPPLDSTMKSIAEAMRVSPAALITSRKPAHTGKT